MWGLSFWMPVLLGILVSLYVYGSRTFGYFTKRNFPFASSLLPFFGSMGPFVFRIRPLADLTKDIYEKYANHKLIGVFEFDKPVIMVRDPELIKMVTVKDFDHFSSRLNHRIVPFTEEIEPSLGKGLVGLEGSKWKEMRSTLNPMFTTSKIKSMFDFVTECGSQMNEYLEKKCKASGGTVQLEMKDLSTRYTNDVIATTIFGVRVDSLNQPANEFFRMGRDITNFGGIRAIVFFGFRISMKTMKFLGFKIFNKKTKAFFEDLIEDSLTKRETDHVLRPDMIHLFMQARKGVLKREVMGDIMADDPGWKKTLASEMSVEDISAQAIFFYIAGFDTMSTSLSFLFILLASHREIQRRVQDEIDEMLVAEGGKITYEGIAGMKYLDMCISEALRMWPPTVVTNRQCVKPYEFPATDTSPAIRVNKGDGLWIPIYAIHRDPKYFANPDTFDPERFSAENKSNIDPYTYMPFGNGPRKCLGMRFALIQSKVAVCSLLSRFDLAGKTKDTANASGLAEQTFNTVFKEGFWLTFKPRVVCQN